MPKTIKKATRRVTRKTAVTAAKKKAPGAKKAPAKKQAPKKRAPRSAHAAGKAPASAAGKTAATRKKTSARTPARRGGAAAGGVKPYKRRKGEKYMNRRQLEHFRKLMISWKEALMQEVDRTVIHMKTDSNNYADSADRATQEEGFSLELRERDRERKLLRKIDQAIARIDNNEYGHCELCGVEIGISRLEARPTATMCIDCKTLDEIRERQMASV